MKHLALLFAFAVILFGCGTSSDEPSKSSPDSAPSTSLVTTTAADPECVLLTGGRDAVATGSVAGDALFLSGESFVCANDVVVTDAADLNTMAAASQLAAAVGGPLLLPDPRLAAELGRLNPQRVHIVGQVTVQTPPDSDVLNHTIADAVDQAKEALGVETEVRLPATPDSTTILETIGAIIDRDRVVFPQTDPSGVAPIPRVDSSEIIVGLANPTPAESVWLLDAADPVELLMAAGTGRTVGSVAVAYDPTDLFGHPQVGEALGGRPISAIRYVGVVPEVSDWELAVLSNGNQLPGGGFLVLPPDQPRRYVAYYGHPETPGLGALGEQGPDATLSELQPFVEAYAADGHQTIPTFEMIATVASADATDGDYSFEWPIATFEPWVETAAENGAYVVLDLQPGRDDFLNQAMQYEELLKLPHVGLALDPEWRLKPDQVHLRQVGQVDAAEVNLVVDWLADLVRDNGLPQKMLIVHQFRLDMIQNRGILKERPELQMILQMDGDGLEAQKDDTYAALTRGTEDAHWSWGWKNFFDEDEPGPPTPESTMSKTPSPVYVSYQ